jgi:hypothetical protein
MNLVPSGTGYLGPSSLSYYTGVPAALVSSGYLSLVSGKNGIQKWTVPSTATYTLVAAGAAGSASTWAAGGNGIVVTNSVSLAKNDILYILVGQKPNGSTGSGGGGTFIAKYNGGIDTSSSSYTLLLVGGGGGGGSYPAGNVGQNGQLTFAGGVDPYGYHTAATNGAQGDNKSPYTNPQSNSINGQFVMMGYPGAGYSGSAIDHTVNSDFGLPPKSFLEGGAGSSTLSGPWGGVGDGGYGGGSVGSNNSQWVIGSGGGYSGGSCPMTSGTSAWGGNLSGGSGGGSYDINRIGTANTVSTGYNSGNGYVTITKN